MTRSASQLSLQASGNSVSSFHQWEVNIFSPLRCLVKRSVPVSQAALSAIPTKLSACRSSRNRHKNSRDRALDVESFDPLVVANQDASRTFKIDPEEENGVVLVGVQGTGQPDKGRTFSTRRKAPLSEAMTVSCPTATTTGSLFTRSRSTGTDQRRSSSRRRSSSERSSNHMAFRMARQHASGIPRTQAKYHIHPSPQ